MTDFKESIKVDLANLRETRLTQQEARRTYEIYVREQEAQFVAFVNYLNQYINSLKAQGVISPFLKFYARIKATNSALKNYEKKALDDIFGIEFICATEEEIEIVQQALRPILKTHKIKEHDKENGYKATHNSCSIRKETKKQLEEKIKGSKQDKFPVMELQYKTVGVYYNAVFGSASHEKYKDTKLPQLQVLYDSGKLEVGTDIPHMWISKADTDNARKLSTEETLKKMYPSLRLKQEREQEKFKKIEESLIQ